MAVDCRTDGSSYSPTSLVTSFHSIPHVDIHLKEAPADFVVSLDYFESIIIWACVPVLICVCIFILLSVYYICVCCCCCCREKKQRPRAINITCAFLISILIVFCLGIIGASLYSEVSLNKEAYNFLNDGRNIVTDVQDINNSIDKYNVSIVSSSLETVISAINASSGANRIEAYESSMRLKTANNDINIAFTNIGDSLSGLQYTDTVDEVEQFETVRNWTVIGFFIFVTLILLLICLVTICMTSVGVIIMLIILGVVTLLVWMLTGGSLAVSIVLADICADPDTLIRNNTKDGLARDVVDYYIVCDNSCSPFQQEFNRTRDAFDAINDAESIVYQYILTNNLNVTTEFQTARDGFQTGETISSNITVKLICSTSQGIHEDYLNGLEHLCDNGYTFVIVILSLLGGLALSFMLLMCCLTCYAGLLVNTSQEDDINNDDIVAFDNNRAVAWSGPSGGRRGSYSEPYANGAQQQHNRGEEFMMSGLQSAAPPKYSDLSSGRPTSGEYDHFDV